MSGTHLLHHATVVVSRVDLSANLAHDLVAADRIFDRQTFAQVQRHRFLQIDVLAGPRGVDRHQRVPVRGRGNDHRVDIPVIQHLPIVGVGLCLWILGNDCIAARFPHVAGPHNGDRRVCGTIVEISAAHAVAADQGHVDLVVGAGFGSPAVDSTPMRRPRPTPMRLENRGGKNC